MASESIAHSADSEPIRARGIIVKYSLIWVCAAVKVVVFKQFSLEEGIEIRWFGFQETDGLRILV